MSAGLLIRRRTSKAASILAVLLLILSACAREEPEVPASDAVRRLKMTLGNTGNSARLAYYVAQERGYFAREGLDIEFRKMGFREEMDALLRGDVAVTSTNLVLPLQIATQDPNLIRLYGGNAIRKDPSNILEGVLALETSGVKTLSDLRGKAVGVPVGAIDKFLFSVILRKAGLDPDQNQIKITELAEEVIPSALISGRVNAAYMTQPRLAAVRKQTGAQYVEINTRAKYLSDPYWSSAGVVTTKFVKENPEALRRLFRALDSAREDMRKDKDGTNRLLVKYAAIDESIVKDIGQQFTLKSTDPVDYEGIERTMNLLVEGGVLAKPVDVRALYVTPDDLED